MIKEIKFPSNLKPGEYRYKYILIDCDGNEIWVDSEGNEKNSFSFIWEKVTEKLKVYSSNNIVSYKRPVELVGVCIGLYGRISLPDITWHLEEDIEGVKIKNGYLIVNDKVADGTEVIVHAKSTTGDLNASKKIIVKNKLKNLIKIK